MQKLVSVLKWIASALALVAGVIGTATSFGDWHVSNGVAGVFLALGAFLGALGVTPMSVPPHAARVLSAVAVLSAGVVGLHAGGQLGGAAWDLFFKVAGVIGVLAGLLGRSIMPSPKAVPAVG